MRYKEKHSFNNISIVAASSGNVTFENSQREHGTSVFFKSESELKDFKLTVNNLETSDQNTITVVFDENSTEGFDKLYDAPKWPGNPDLSFYSLLGNKKLAINSLPELENGVMVNVGLYAGKSGNYTFSVHTMDNFEPGTPIVLEDRLTGEQVDFTFNPEYSFTISEPGTYNDRFVLYFKSAVGINHDILVNEPLVSVQNNQLNITNLEAGKVDVSLVDVAGRVIDRRSFSGLSSVSMPLSVRSGIYILGISTKQRTFAHKIFIR